mmetsp:Transcript_18275/g.38379  ORF Transcript_18275/g.38379 Transcript_18275/m.38379 type:complete len:484 (-) Transcript_18275:114-1565(-)
MLNVAKDAKDQRQSRHGIHHIHRGNTVVHLLRSTESISNAFLLITAVFARGANTGGGAGFISCADGLEHHGKLQRTTNGHAVNVHGGQDDHTTLILGSKLILQILILHIVLQPSAAFHTFIDHLGIHARMLHRILKALLAREVLLGIASVHELIHVIPPRLAHPVVLAIHFPDAHPPQTLPHDIGARNAAIQIIVGIRGAVPSVVRAQVVTVVLPVDALASRSDSVVDVHLGGEVRALPQSDGRLLELALEVARDDIGGRGPQLVLHAIIGIGQTPRHFDPHGMIRLHLRLDQVGILLEHEKRGDGNVRTASIIGHDRLAFLALLIRIGMTRIPRRAKAGVIGDNHSRRPHALGIAHLLNEGASAAIDHEDVGRLPRKHFFVVVHGADGVPAAGVDGVEVAEGVFGVVHVLGDGAAVGGDSEEGLAVFVSAGLVESFGNMNIKFARCNNSRGGFVLSIDGRAAIAAQQHCQGGGCSYHSFNLY